MAAHSTRSKDPLIQTANLKLYRRNVFRITGLPVDASARQIAKRANQLKLAGSIGHDTEQKHSALSIHPAPNDEQIQEALQRIKEPELRLIDEYFWFWPMHESGSAQDPALQALQAGEIPDALEVWREKESDATCGAIAAHNLAVFDHMVAIDWTLAQFADPTNADAATRAERYWQQAMDRWEHVATDGTVWDWLKDRIRTINDPRLTTGFARRMEAALPEAMDKINAQAALRFAKAGDIDAARMHIRIMNQTHQGLDDVESTAEMVLMPLRRRIEQRIAHAKKAAKADGTSAVTIAQGLLNESIPMMPLFELFHGDSHHKTELFDEVAETANQLGVIYQKATEQNEGLVELLSHAMTCASGEDLKSRIRENIRLIEGNLRFDKIMPVLEAIKDLNESKATPAVRLNQIENRIIAMAAPFASEPIGEKTLADLVASTLRNISIDAFNDGEDIATAQKAICLAGDHAEDEQLIKQIAKDRRLVEERLGRSLCVHCGKRVGDPAYKHEFAMYGDVKPDLSGPYGRIQYRTGKISVPRCTVCGQIHKKSKANANALCLGIIGLSIVLGFYFMAQIGIVGFWFIVGGILVGLVSWNLDLAPHNNAETKARKHPNIRELQSKGWQFGHGPSQN